MNFFEKLALRSAATDKTVATRQGRALVRLMRGYRQAWHTGEAVPSLPRTMQRRFAVVAVWACFRLSIHEPVMFFVGAMAFVPALLLTLFGVAKRVFLSVGMG